jgi:regulator of sigma E protease
MSWLGPFLLLLGPLVVIHELGHFLVAKFFGVLCERFAIGFGPALFRYKFGETEYVIAALPLGGYVKMLGESGEEDLTEAQRRRSFSGQSPLRRTLIALAGPAMNVLLAIVVMAGVLMTIGFPDLTSKIGTVRPGTPAERAGLRGGDRIVGIDGTPISRWEELRERISDSKGRALELRIDRNGQELALRVTPEVDATTGASAIGIDHGTPEPVLAFPAADAAGARAGLRTGDRVVALNGVPIADMYALRWELAKASGPLSVDVERRQGDKDRARVSATVDDGAEGPWSTERLGAVEIDFAIQELGLISPAKNAGLQRGDVFLEVNGAPVTSAADLEAKVQETAGEAIRVKVLRSGEIVEAQVLPMLTQGLPPGTPPHWELGIQPAAPRTAGEEIRQYVRNPFVAAVQATTYLWAQVVDMFSKLITRQVGMDAVTGPIGIGEIAVNAFQEPGWFTFLYIMALISVNLAIINLLPVPVLDGGHIVFAAAEAISGGPLGQRSREVAQALGLSFILMLMGFAFWNDIARNWQRIAHFFQELL